MAKKTTVEVVKEIKDKFLKPKLQSFAAADDKKLLLKRKSLKIFKTFKTNASIVP